MPKIIAGARVGATLAQCWTAGARVGATFARFSIAGAGMGVPLARFSTAGFRMGATLARFWTAVVSNGSHFPLISDLHFFIGVLNSALVGVPASVASLRRSRSFH